MDSGEFNGGHESDTRQELKQETLRGGNGRLGKDPADAGGMGAAHGVTVAGSNSKILHGQGSQKAASDAQTGEL